MIEAETTPKLFLEPLLPLVAAAVTRDCLLLLEAPRERLPAIEEAEVDDKRVKASAAKPKVLRKQTAAKLFMGK